LDITSRYSHIWAIYESLLYGWSYELAERSTKLVKGDKLIRDPLSTIFGKEVAKNFDESVAVKLQHRSKSQDIVEFSITCSDTAERIIRFSDWHCFVYAFRNVITHGLTERTLGDSGCLPMKRRVIFRKVLEKNCKDAKGAFKHFSNDMLTLLNYMESQVDSKLRTAIVSGDLMNLEEISYAVGLWIPRIIATLSVRLYVDGLFCYYSMYFKNKYVDDYSEYMFIDDE
jgi:hypothetical protein